MRELVRYLARTSVAWLPLLATVAMLVWMFVDTRSTWAGDWWWGYNSVAQTLSISSILVAFAAGWDSGAAGSGFRHNEDLRPVSRWSPELVRLAWVAVPVLAVYAGAVVTVAVITLAEGGRVDPRLVLVATSHALMLLVAGSFGTFAGRHLPSAPAGLAAAAVTGVLAFVTSGSGHQIFGLTGASSPVVGFTASLSYFSWSIAVLTLCLVFLHLPADRGGRPRLGFWTTVTAVLAAITLSAFTGPQHQFATATPGATRCADSPVELCVYPGYDRLLESSRQLVTAQIKAAARAGIGQDSFPSRLEQMGGGRMTSPGVGPLHVPMDALTTGSVGAYAVANSLSSPTWCRSMFVGPAPGQLLARRQLVLDWLLWTSGHLREREMRNLHPAFVALDPSQQTRTIAAALRDNATCVN